MPRSSANRLAQDDILTLTMRSRAACPSKRRRILMSVVLALIMSFAAALCTVAFLIQHL
jgi:hypothetical protein